MFVLTVQHKELWHLKCCTCQLIMHLGRPNWLIQGKICDKFDSEVYSSRKELIYWSSNLFKLISSFIQNLPLFSAKTKFELWFKNIYFLQLLVFWNWWHKFQTFNVIDFFYQYFEMILQNVLFIKPQQKILCYLINQNRTQRII